MTSDDAIAGYDAAAAELAARYDDPALLAIHADLRHFLPERCQGRLALDVGAGSGRDAGWLAGLGYEVIAVEPADRMRAEGMRRHGGPAIRWLGDRLPGLAKVHALAIGFDLILLSAVWQHVAPEDRPRAFRKLATLLKPGGLLVLSLRSGPALADRPMYEVGVGEVESLAHSHGLEVARIAARPDAQHRDDVQWTTIVLRLPDDGSGALPLIRGIILADDKSSTYKLALLRAVARIAEHAAATALPAEDGSDSVVLPLGLVALFWIRMYLPLVRAGLPQAPRNSGPDGLGFAKSGFRQVMALAVALTELRVGAIFAADTGSAVASALERGCRDDYHHAG
ncbi:MAG: class I SAM-dependent methyltransferase [Sphingomonas sp.]|uniref:class I SAM-dependent methyltransferase n=1 Tax=Sphingomonas sp. TaxID=28214 RepID=UPI0025FE600E|nr:class I SAM-dependent methyltransferase [Sphingomonas sp.]MBX3566319.1 class I SAM-dependent methyltransferase [Sphingomonas sp.]